jgi:hypothetical protein
MKGAQPSNRRQKREQDTEGCHTAFLYPNQQ